MRKNAFALALAMSAVLTAQESKQANEPLVYRAEFTIRDGSDAAGKAGRRYTMLLDSTGKGVIRVGNRVPIDCRVRDIQGKVGLNAEIDVSTIIEHPKGAAEAPPNPTIASVRMTVSTTLNAGKPTLVASINDPITMRTFDVEATITKVN